VRVPLAHFDPKAILLRHDPVNLALTILDTENVLADPNYFKKAA
jgi:hypothetical protein